MKKEFTTYNQSLRLKSLGFNEPCFGYYDCDRNFHIVPSKDKLLECEIPRPTFSQAFRWFREKYNLHGFVMDNEDGHFWWGISILFSGETEEDSSEIAYDETYEEAELACLEKLIEIVEAKSE